MRLTEDFWQEIKNALVGAEWGYDRYGEFGEGEQNKLVATVLDKLQSMGEITKEQRE